jgi:hypothetical protein
MSTMDELNQGLSSLVRFGVSEQLIQDLRAIEESADMHGKALYEQAAIYEMRCAILCRNYAKALWEYSHFMALIEHESDAGVIEYFWEQNILSTTRFRHWLAEAVRHSHYLSEDNGVFKALIGKREFILNAKRINLMAAWTAFLVIVEPALLIKLQSFKTDLNEKAIDAFSKQLKTALDAYLEPHLQAIHQQRQGRVLLTWLQEHTGQTDANALLQDETVLAFWQHNALTKDGDFKRFSTVADCAYRLHEAIELSDDQRQIEGARSYHQDQQGDNADWLIDEVSQINTSENLFDNLLDSLMYREPVKAVASLGKPPLDQIKFLTSKDAVFCEKFELAGPALSTLPLTFLRAQVFGLQQARLTEDIRATKGQNLAKLLEMDGLIGFSAWQNSLSEQLEKIAQTRSAVAYVLLQYAHPVALASVLEALSDEQKANLHKLIEDQPGTRFGNSLMTHLTQMAPVEIKRLETAFSKVNREGFKTLPEADQTDNFLAGDEHLKALENMLHLYAKHLARIVELQGGLATIEAKDAAIFSQTFALLYAQQGVTI